jgi:anaerobic magnesium-protoporphyrin IX monomethyl ester cyclase
MLYVTPHRWTPYFETVHERKVIETNSAKWDYKHQVLETKRVPPWRILLWVKSIEVIMQMRPRALMRVVFGKDRDVRKGMRWYTRMGRRVWMGEIVEFMFSKRLKNSTLTLCRFLGASLARNEESMVKRKKVVIPIKAA